MEKAVYSAVLTPFKKDLTIDTKLFISHCEFLLKNNISLAPLGTTGEANSISISEKVDLIKTIANSDLPKEKIIIGTGNTSFIDAAFLTKTAVENKIYSVLLLPPFYYKNVSDEGVYQYYKKIINTVKSTNLRIFLYNIPQVSGVIISIELQRRHAAEDEDAAIHWRQLPNTAAQFIQVARVSALIHNTHQEEHGRSRQAVIKHLQHGAIGGDCCT